MALDESAGVATYDAPKKDLYEVGEMPPMGYVPKQMYAWTIRRDTPGDGTQEHHPRAIRLAFSGDHGWGAAGRWDARLIDAVMKETIERHAPQALILDLRELDYRWGDDIARIMEPRNIPVAIVVSPRCAAGLESLADALGLEACNILFASPEAARRHLRDTRQTGARGTTPRTA